MILLENLLKQYTFKRRATKIIPDIHDIEKQIGFALPEDYLFYLTNFKEYEGFIGLEYVHLCQFEDLLAFNKSYQIIESLPKTLGIGSNRASEFIAIEYLGNTQYHIIISPFIDLDKQYNIDIGNSFTNFINRLDNGKTWFT